MRKLGGHGICSTGCSHRTFPSRQASCPGAQQSPQSQVCHDTPISSICPLPRAGTAPHIPFSTETVPYFIWLQQIPTEMSPCFISGMAEDIFCILRLSFPSAFLQDCFPSRNSGPPHAWQGDIISQQHFLLCLLPLTSGSVFPAPQTLDQPIQQKPWSCSCSYHGKNCPPLSRSSWAQEPCSLCG